MRKGEIGAGVETGVTRASLEKIGTNQTQSTRLNGMPAGSDNMPFSSCHMSPNSNIWKEPCRAMETCIITSEFMDTGHGADETGCGRDVGIPCDNRILSHGNGKSHVL